MCACKNGNFDIVKILLDGGSDFNWPSQFLNIKKKKYYFNYQTPMTLAIKGGFYEIICLLLDKGASPNSMNKSGLTPLMEVIINYNWEKNYF